MLGACRKETYSSKLVLKDVVSGLPKVGRIPPGVPLGSCLNSCYSLIMKIVHSLLKSKKIVLIILGILSVIVLCSAWWYVKKIRERSYTDYPSEYPYSCNINGEYKDLKENPGQSYSCPVTEDEGKVKVANRVEVKNLVRQYGRKGVTIQALEFKDIQDKEFLKRLLCNNYTELGCIILVSYPGGQNVYLENDELEVINKLDGTIFAQWLRSATPEDFEKFYSNVH